MSLRILGARDPLEKRISRFVDDAMAWVDHVWPERQGPGPPDLRSALRHLESRWPAAELPALASDVLFDPARWFARDPGRSGRIQHLLWVYVAKRPPMDIAGRIEARIRRMLERPCDSEVPLDPRAFTSSPNLFYSPDLGASLELPTRVSSTHRVVELIRRIVVGEFNEHPVPAPCFLRNRQMPDLVLVTSANAPAMQGYDRPGVAYPYEIWRHELARHFPELMECLFGRGLLPFETFRTATAHLPMILSEASQGYAPPFRVPPFPGWRPAHAVGAEFSSVVQGYCDRLTSEVCEGFDDRSAEILSYVESFRGFGFLRHAARLHAQRGIGKVAYDGHRYRRDAASVVVRLAQAQDAEPSDPVQRRTAVQELRTFPAETLKRLLPVAAPARRLLLEALGWEDADALLQQILHVSGLDRSRPPWETMKRSSADPTEGVVDVPSVRRALEMTDPKRAKELLKLFREARVYADISITLIEAVAGWNRADIEKRVAKRSQPAVRAYGLLPIERGEEEVRERYLFFKRFSEESKKFGAMRRQSENGAARAGLANLAQVAGYGTPLRLELALESDLAGAVSIGRTWMIDAYGIELTYSESGPSVIVRKGSKPLASIPPTVRKHEGYREVKAAVELLRNQHSRFRAAFETLMTDQEGLGATEIRRLLTLPVARRLLASLVVRGNDGTTGLLDEETSDLRTPDGRVPLPEVLMVAHPHDLFQLGQLGIWQAEIVHRRIVQPFKQAFRELYVLTPAERESRTSSNRFAGRRLRSGVAARLFQARSWQFETGDVAVPIKVFAKARLKAVFDFPEAGHFLAEEPEITSDRVFFLRHPSPSVIWSNPQEAWLPLEDVPPVVFSEVMRDADLVVSVAQLEGETLVSPEAVRGRADIVRTLLGDLGLSGVRLDGHFAFVEGKLAHYKVHLGTAHIYIDPGNYLCIVPDRWGRSHEKLFLPFQDEHDLKTAEVISKILLLLSDDKIRDRSILEQIRRGGLSPAPLH